MRREKLPSSPYTTDLPGFQLHLEKQNTSPFLRMIFLQS
jgi:hypothetical protein